MKALSSLAAALLLALTATAHAVTFRPRLVCVTDDGKEVGAKTRRAPDQDLSCQIVVRDGSDVLESPEGSVILSAAPKVAFPVRTPEAIHRLKRGDGPVLRYVDAAKFAHGTDFPRCADVVINAIVSTGKRGSAWRTSLTVRSACPVPKVSPTLACNLKRAPNTVVLGSRNDPPAPEPVTCRLSIPHSLHPAGQAEFFAEDASALLVGRAVEVPLIEDDGHDPGARAAADVDVQFDPDASHRCAPRIIRAAITQDGAIVWTGKTTVVAPQCR